jgi:hypothetical protein
MIAIDMSSVRIEGLHSGTTNQEEDVKPSASTTETLAVLHLNRNSEGIVNRRWTGDDDEDEPALGAVYLQGDVDVSLGPRDDLSKWDFHFIQLTKNYTDRVIYAGRRPSEGAMIKNYAAAPGYPSRFADKFSLDSNAKYLPFYNLRTRTGAALSRKATPGSKNVSTEMFDHPARWIPLKTRNPKSGAAYYLAKAVSVFEALTVFVVRDEKRQIRQLANVTWSVHWSVTFQWRRGKVQTPSVLPGGSFFYIDKAIKGPPSDKVLERMIQDSQSINSNETSNQLLKQAIDNVEKSQATSQMNLTLLDKRPNEVLANFSD